MISIVLTTAVCATALRYGPMERTQENVLDRVNQMMGTGQIQQGSLLSHISFSWKGRDSVFPLCLFPAWLHTSSETVSWQRSPP